MKFKSKVDVLLSLLVWAAAGSSLIMTIYVAVIGKAEAFSTITTAMIVGFITWLWSGTYYILDEKFLIVRAGPVNTKIKYNDIVGVKSAKTFMAAPALSFDRLEIRYGQKEVVYISPKEKADFIRELELKCKQVKEEKRQDKKSKK